MKRLAILFLISLSVLQLTYSQDYKITFSGSGSSSKVDSVTIENLTKGTTLRIGGADTLVLTKATGVEIKSNVLATSLKVYPNPFSSNCKIEFSIQNKEIVYLNIYDISGKIAITTKQMLESGMHQFQLSGLAQGMHVVQLCSAHSCGTAKIISFNTDPDNPEIVYQGNVMRTPTRLNLKSGNSESTVALLYEEGDEILLTAESTDEITGQKTTTVQTIEMTENPVIEEKIEFEFIECVDRNGKSYAIIEIGDQVWMAENYALKTDSGSWAYNDDESMVETYGRLYTWETAKLNAPEGWHLPTDDEWKKLEITLGLSVLDSENVDFRGENIGSKLKLNSGWDDGGNGSNSSGFSAVPGGARWFYNETFYNLGIATYWWTATPFEEIRGLIRKLTNDNNGISRGASIKEYGFSVRYIKDTGVPVVSSITASYISNTSATMNGSIDSNGGEAIKECGIYWSKTNTTPNSGDNIALSEQNDGQFSVSLTGLESNTSYYFRAFASNSNGISLGKVLMFTTNIESNPIVYGSALLGGNVYKTITIGEQTWMAENYRELPMVSPATFNSDKVPMCYVYGYAGTNSSEAKQSTYYAKYGALYNWIAANFYCPEGWHLPSIDEWKQLTNYIQNNSGIYLNNANVGKSLALQNSWFEQPDGNYNSTGFSAVPGGMFQSEIATFVHNATNGFWWTSNETTFVNDVYLSAGFFNLYSALGMGFYTDGYRKTYGMSVRYVKDK